jgi:ABC-type xylose transport system permease subunit
LADFGSIARDNLTMRTVAVIFALALITIAFEIYSDAVLTSAEVSHTAAPDPATAAIAHGLKHG